MICQGLSREQSNALYLEVLEANDTKAMRDLCRSDLFFLLTVACKRKDIDKDWLYDRCREVEANPDGHLDLWFREGYKSTIITFGKTIQDILNDPNITAGIFSHTRPIAKAFLEQIKREFETNSFLQDLFPEILFKNPRAEAAKWSLDSGLIVKRTQNPKECTLEAWGVVDGQPTGKHFKLLVYDDVVTKESVSSPEQIRKTTDSLALSYNLGAEGGTKRFIGTRYHANDTYKTIMDRGTVIPRIHRATDTGKLDGQSVFLPQDVLMEKRRDFGPYIFSCQMLQDPVADNAMGFKEEWLHYYSTLADTSGWNVYIVIDPANAKKASSDYTVMEVIGLAPDNNYYLLKGIRDRLNLTQRAQKLFELHREYSPVAVGYERYGMQSDVEHMKYVMEQENYRFKIVELGGQMAKTDRIGKLVPVFEQGRFYMPKTQYFVNYEGRRVDYVATFIEEEYLSFPVSTHDDMLDCRARILDPVLGAKFPVIKKLTTSNRPAAHRGSSGWMS